MEEEFLETPRNKFSPNYKFYLASCLKKLAFNTREKAIINAFSLGQKMRKKCGIYKCPFCGNWHMTTHTWRKTTELVTNKKGNLIFKIRDLIIEEKGTPFKMEKQKTHKDSKGYRKYERNLVQTYKDVWHEQVWLPAVYF